MYEMTKRYEGLRLEAYPDPATGGEPWTIGYGSTTYPDGRKVKKGDKITQKQADEMLIYYINKNILPVYNKIPYKLTDDQKDAICSLCYNVGTPAFTRSKLFTAICKKDLREIVKQWDFGFNTGLKGIFKRRTEELFMFMKGL